MVETMKDKFGDAIEVRRYASIPNRLFVTFQDAADGETMDMSLTAKKARKLARILNRAASRIEIAETGK